jgi:ribonuclease HI|tara:strand:- start:2255 stop:2794 length:540 start_codon:yes stop_codon:yes gene_type:complete
MNSVSKISVYVDGSCEENKNVTSETPAGWGFCIVIGDTGLGKGQGEITIEKSGRVITANESIDFIGAEVGSNNTAELCAIAHSLKWLLIEGSNTPAVIRGDSQYALNIGSSTWKAKANKALALYVQKLWNEVASFRNLSHEHVRAHRGHRWNERADHLAYRAMQGKIPLPVQFWKPGQR